MAATPALVQLAAAGIAVREHRYDNAVSGHGFGKEAADKLGLDARQVFKTLVAVCDGHEFVVAVVPVAGQLNLKALAAAAGAKKAELAPVPAAERKTGYITGGISPFGQKTRLRTFVDESALGFATVFVSGGARGFDIEVPPSAFELLAAEFASIARD